MVVVVGMVVVVVVVVLVVVVVDVVVVGAWVVVVVVGQLPNVTVMVGAQFVLLGSLENRVNGPVGQLREILVVYSQQPLRLRRHRSSPGSCRMDRQRRCPMKLMMALKMPELL